MESISPWHAKNTMPGQDLDREYRVGGSTSPFTTSTAPTYVAEYTDYVVLRMAQTPKPERICMSGEDRLDRGPEASSLRQMDVVMNRRRPTNWRTRGGTESNGQR